MAASLKPWIYSYLIDIAETYGADMTSVPEMNKKKKVQVIDFLTYHENDVLWGYISDKEYLVPIRFSLSAEKEYNLLHGTRITHQKTAIISIWNFKPFFSRIPRKNTGMSEMSYIAIHCESFSPIGSFGEDTFGSPKLLDSNCDLEEWVEGLRKDGGAGNCLKNRKAAREKAVKVDSRNDFSSVTVISTAFPRQRENTATEQNNAITKKYAKDDSWKIVGVVAFHRPPPEVAQLHVDMRVEGDSESVSSDLDHPQTVQDTQVLPNPMARVPATPITTENSSPRLRSATPFSESEWPLSYPVQVPCPSPLRSSPSLSHSNPVSGSPTGTSSVSKSHLPPLKPPSFSPTAAPLTVIAEKSDVGLSTIHTWRRDVLRKVSPPRQPTPTDHSQARTVILVPNSDTSLSHSQPASQLQSQSQSQPVITLQLASSETQDSSQQEPSKTSLHHIAQTKAQRENHNPNSFASERVSQGYDGDRSSPSRSSPGLSLTPAQIAGSSSSNCNRLNKFSSKNEVKNDDSDIGRLQICSLGLPAKKLLPPIQVQLDEKEKENSSLFVHDSQSLPSERIKSDGISRSANTRITSNGQPSHCVPPPPVTINEKATTNLGIKKTFRNGNDVQTHSGLPISSLQPRASATQQPSQPLSAIVPFGELRTPGSQLATVKVQLNSVQKSSASTSLVIEPASGDGSSIANEETVVSEVIHDPRIWRAPSFLTPGVAPGKVGGDPGEAQLPASQVHGSCLSSTSRTSKSRFTRKYQKLSSPIGRGTYIPDVTGMASRQEHQSIEFSSKHTISGGNMASGYIEKQSPEQRNSVGKQRDDTNKDQVAYPILTVTKRRFSAASEGSNGSSASQSRKKQRRKGSNQLKQKDYEDIPKVVARAGERLNGYCANLDRISLKDVTKPVVTWARLLEILHFTDKHKTLYHNAHLS